MQVDLFISTALSTPWKGDANGNALMAMAGVLPSGAAAARAASGNVAANPAVATIAAVAAKTNYIAGLLISGLGATAAANVTATIAGLLGGSMLINVAVPAGVTTQVGPIYLSFDTPIPASAVNTAIIATLPSFGAGNTNASIEIWGFTL